MMRRDRLALAHPVSLAAIGLLIVNDHILKEVWPGFATGKLSDLAGLVFFPLLLVAIHQLVTGRAPVWLGIGAVVATGMCFALIQVWGPAAGFYRDGLGYLQLPFRFLMSGSASVGPVQHVADPSDLMVLPALAVSWRILLTQTTSTGRPTAIR